MTRGGKSRARLPGASAKSRPPKATARRSSTICRPRRRRSTIRSRAAARSRWKRSGSGLRAYGSDLNPVAVLIGKALVEIPPKFAGLPPVNPKVAGRSSSAADAGTGKGAQGLAEDVRYYGQWMRDEAEKRIGHLYPKAKLPDGSEATVIAWLWARTVRSPDPAAKGAMVPLVSSFMLSTKEGKKAWVEPVIDPTAPDGWRFRG